MCGRLLSLLVFKHLLEMNCLYKFLLLDNDWNLNQQTKNKKNNVNKNKDKKQTKTKSSLLVFVLNKFFKVLSVKKIGQENKKLVNYCAYSIIALVFEFEFSQWFLLHSYENNLLILENYNNINDNNNKSNNNNKKNKQTIQIYFEKLNKRTKYILEKLILHFGSPYLTENDLRFLVFNMMTTYGQTSIEILNYQDT